MVSRGGSDLETDSPNTKPASCAANLSNFTLLSNDNEGMDSASVSSRQSKMAATLMFWNLRQCWALQAQHLRTPASKELRLGIILQLALLTES